MERKEAISLGLVKYNTGRACRNGHFDDRYTKSGACAACINKMLRDSNIRYSDLKSKIESSTVQIYLYSQATGFAAIKLMLDSMVAARLPALSPDAVNPMPFKQQLVSNKTYRIAVRVPNADVEAAYAMGKLLLEKE